MSRARHKTHGKAHGGKVKHREAGGKSEVGNPHVFAEARGEPLGPIHGEGGKKRMDRKRGGSCKADGGKAGSDAHPYTGGKSGSAEHPYTSAHKSGGKAASRGR
jgi:hypothetical protein